MNNKPWWKHFFSWWVLLGGCFISILLIGLVAGGLIFLRAPRSSAVAPMPAITVIAAPSLTPAIRAAINSPTSTPTPSASQSVQSSGSISVGTYVQITGTGGVGLRIRSSPGVNGPPRFLGMEAEVYQVEDGPKVADGFTWWYLVAPYDKNRSGWAAANYLVVIQKP